MGAGPEPFVLRTAERPATAGGVPRVLSTFAIWLAIGVGVGLVAVVALPGVLGFKTLTVVSGSMQPTLETGSVVIDEVISPLDARSGDILTFQDPARSRQLTHRLKRMSVRGDTAYMVTQGDANDAPERWSVPLDGQIGRVVVHVPKLGHVRAALATREARLGLLAALLGIGSFFLIDLWRPRKATP